MFNTPAWPGRSPISSKSRKASSQLTGFSSWPRSIFAQSMMRRASAMVSLSPAASACSTACVHHLMARRCFPPSWQKRPYHPKSSARWRVRVHGVDVLEDSDAPRDPAQCIGEAVEPAFDAGQLQEQPGLRDGVVADQPAGRPVGARRAGVVAGQVPGVPQPFMCSRDVRRRQVRQPAGRGDRPLEVLRRLQVGVHPPGPFRRLERVRPRLLGSLGVEVVEGEQFGLVVTPPCGGVTDGVAGPGVQLVA